MRSVIDHLHNPELATLEAYRVLRSGGELIIGLSVKPEKGSKEYYSETIKNITRNILSVFGIKRFIDYHVWHPTFNELCSLIQQSGFEIKDVLWHKGWENKVCYIRSKK